MRAKEEPRLSSSICSLRTGLQGNFVPAIEKNVHAFDFYGGYLWPESEGPGIGTTIWFHMPLKQESSRLAAE
jgi:hypothetical protein